MRTSKDGSSVADFVLHNRHKARFLLMGWNKMTCGSMHKANSKFTFLCYWYVRSKNAEIIIFKIYA